ncbi:monolysocardiolipin acyltransferase [Sporothrix brasiliensis 5110]|uniref:Tafazzin family protein n=1 Tax=Sporothrix brasiliensis 5110 TaxID=1398154 RepID=A0A0C2EPJ9_9PEZI|nr:monolysocardiolipin acyltransferase [Sporothrix brasiliensis 5110]KIH88134.1 monolysocardiolipin acyltransferase [Sporothrix brasiliensis 5110]
MSVANAKPRKPGALWRAASTFVMATTGMLCRSFLYGLNDVEVVGLDNFLKLLDARKDVEARQRGLITASSSAPSDSGPLPQAPATSSKSPASEVFASSFSPSLYYSTNGADRWPAPSAFASNRHAWVHVFPEGLVHQQRDRGLRYFKWGVARLILESEPTPDIVPMFIDGLDRVMHEERTFPRFLPRIGQKIRVVFGDILDPEAFADLRDRWQRLVARSLRSTRHSGARTDGPDGATAVEIEIDLKYGEEAQQLRKETAHRMREEILKLRRRFGYAEEDPRLGLAETWADEPNKKRYRSQVDDSMVYRE